MRSTEHAATYRADKLCDQESERKKEIDLVRSSLKQNGYPDRLLYRKKSANATKNQEHETRGLAILPDLRGLTDKIKRCLTTHKIQAASKPVRKLGNLLTSIKDPVDIKSRQGVFIPFHAVTAINDTLEKPKEAWKPVRKNVKRT